METIQSAERRYFVSVRGVARVAGDGFPHESFLRVPTLTPQHPRQLFSRPAGSGVPDGGRGSARGSSRALGGG